MTVSVKIKNAAWWSCLFLDMCILLDAAIFDLGIYNSAILALVQKYVFAMTFSTLFLIQKIEANIVVSQ